MDNREEKLWRIGTTVQRKDGKRGPPPYRFRGTVCGHYRNPVTGQRGYVVSSLAEPGCCQIFPAEQVEKANGPNTAQKGPDNAQ